MTLSDVEIIAEYSGLFESDTIFSTAGLQHNYTRFPYKITTSRTAPAPPMMASA